MEELITEIREDYQIPPYYPDKGIGRLITEGMEYLSKLNPGCDIRSDVVYRSLVKNYSYYAYHHKVDEFQTNYARMILTWQLESEVTDGNTS